MKAIKIILILVLAILISFHFYLPIFIKRYVENQINKIPHYRLTISKVDVSLIAGSYTLKNIQLWKIPKHLPVPYLQATSVNFSVEGRALLKGKFVAQVNAQHPILNFVDDPANQSQQLTIDGSWLALVKTLFPLNINRFDAHDGEIYFRSYKGFPPFSNYIKNIQFTIQNMQNAERSSILLPSSFKFTGQPMGKGQLEMTGKFDPFNKQPTFSLDAKLTSLNIAQIADLIKHYISVDIRGGRFSLYGEAAAAKGQIKGYAKPFLKDLKIGKTDSQTGGLINAVAKVTAKILENPKNKTIATKINISGSIDDPDTSTLSIILYLLKHAFIQALLPQIDHSVEIQDVIYGKSLHPKSKFPTYRN